jgi:Fic family protein
MRMGKTILAILVARGREIELNTFQPTFTITHRMTQAITRIERARGFLEAAQLSADWVREVGEQALILEAHHTTHIEGTRLTLDQAERLWKGEAVPEADPDDARELLNYRTAFEFVSECLDSGDPISEGMIREIHRKLVEGWRRQRRAGRISAYPELRGRLRHRSGDLHPAHRSGGAGDDVGAGQVAEGRPRYPPGAGETARPERAPG